MLDALFRDSERVWGVPKTITVAGKHPEYSDGTLGGGKMSIKNLKGFQKENFQLFSPKNNVRDFCAFSGQDYHVLGTQTRPDSQNSGSDTTVTTVRSTFRESESKIVCFGGSPHTAMQNKL